MRLLILDDNLRYSELLAERLQKNDFATDLTHTIEEFEASAEISVHALFVVDLNLPDGDGVELIRRRRRAGCKQPIIVVSGRTAVSERIKALDAGADDYLVKPFSAMELLARIKALLRRPPINEQRRILAGRLSLDPLTDAISLNGALLQMSPTERRLLSVLVRRLGTIVPRETIAVTVNGVSGNTSPNAIEQQVSRLRRTICNQPMGLQLRTVRGSGYVLEVQGASAAVASAHGS